MNVHPQRSPALWVLQQAALTLACLLSFGSCQLIQDDIQFPSDLTGKNVIRVSSGWAFVQAAVDLENGSGPLADPLLGGSDVGLSLIHI